MLYAAGFIDPNIRLWFDADGLVLTAAYAWFEPPGERWTSVSTFGLVCRRIIRLPTKSSSGLSNDGKSLGALVEESIPKAYVMLRFGDTLSRRPSFRQPRSTATVRASHFWERHGFRRVDGFTVLYSRCLVGASKSAPELPAGLRLRHTTDADASRHAWMFIAARVVRYGGSRR